ncbi:response regulator [Clostridium estertheticum]|uniref:Stage 0 sporulation protein A homolog n=1 Tax=Clostridium estertheticum TaxID=238834 RepID=A0A7Y3WR38_9CLOT|nr:response regulator [Clostridium estertheticum]MBW9171503.1 response regulator [Clostridium estertheticum]NNU74548.1 response regulator [Clostridium estertheticum]WBL48954.1 response regulator [Clostridium estertheticum]WLC77006.1 response regulator [Clostridium estertheticum]
MIKLLIAEDEALERKALRFLLEKYFSQIIEVVGEVNNGRDAVDTSLLLKPQIILMDIHMPIMEGLEACSIIKENHSQTEFIILTAFNYFDYAKKAIHIGVSDYLLKPFSNDEFVNSINKVIIKINTKNLIENKNNQLKETYKKISPYVEKQMVENIAYGVTLTEDQFNAYRNIFEIDSSKFCCLVFNLNEKKLFDENSIVLIKNRLNILFPSIIGGLCLNDIILFVFDESVGSKILSREFKNLLNDLRLEFKSNYDITVSIGISAVNDGLNQLYLAYKEAKRCSDNGSKLQTNISTVGNVNEVNNILSGKVIKEDLNGAIIELDTILSNLLIIDGGSNLVVLKKMLLHIIDSVVEDINKFTGKDFKDFSKDKILEELINLKKISELKNCVSLVLKDLITYISSYKRSKNIDVVEKVKEYIENNYMNDVSLDNLAHYISMSSFYLSRIFSKVEGTNIKEYIIKIRMEKAKSMLIEGKKSVKQISLEVGYLDQNYFSKAFKKYTNISPKEYCNL